MRFHSRFFVVGAKNLERQMISEKNGNPTRHTQKMKIRLQEVVDHLRDDIEIVDEPRLKAMFETSAEVLLGLTKAFTDYEQKSESAWR
jgi:predicted ATPase with chaperone activity